MGNGKGGEAQPGERGELVSPSGDEGRHVEDQSCGLDLDSLARPDFVEYRGQVEAPSFGVDGDGCGPAIQVLGLVRGGVDTVYLQGLAGGTGAARQVMAPSFGLDANQLVGHGISSIEDLLAVVRHENPGIAEKLIRDAVRVVSHRVVDFDMSLFTAPNMDDGSTGGAFSGLEGERPKVDLYAVKQAVQAHLMGAHMSSGKLHAGMELISPPLPAEDDGVTDTTRKRLGLIPDGAVMITNPPFDPQGEVDAMEMAGEVHHVRMPTNAEARLPGTSPAAIAVRGALDVIFRAGFDDGKPKMILSLRVSKNNPNELLPPRIDEKNPHETDSLKPNKVKPNK